MVRTSYDWHLSSEDVDLSDRISRELSIPPLLARLLVSRGMTGAEEVYSFLHPNLRQLHDPFLLEGMDRAVKRISEALDLNECIAVHGDYDADGITSTALMVKMLGGRAAKGRLVHRLPSRFDEGYGISVDSVRSLSEEGASLLISVDCGVQAIEAVETASSLGMDVLITDHHEPGPEVPRAVAVLDPKLKGSSYPFKGLSGVGVAFKLVQALRSSGAITMDVRERLDLVALGTIADLVPLIDENRPMVLEGLQTLSRTGSRGLLSLLRETGIEPSRGISSTEVSHRIAPRLNAAGRLGHPDLALELLLTEDRVDADVFARELNSLNFRRQSIANRTVEEALAVANASGSMDRPSIVVAREGWNPGVLGIVANRLVEETGKPSVVLSIEGGTAKGSARAPGGYDLLSALSQMSSILAKWGGHDRAAGLTLDAGSIGTLNDGLDNYTLLHYGGKAPAPVLRIDLDLSLGELDIDSVRSFEMLQPTGAGNPPLMVCIRGLKLSPDIQSVGEGKHLRFYVEGDGIMMGCIWFNAGDIAGTLSSGTGVSMASTPDINRWGGQEDVQLKVVDLRPSKSR